MTEGRPLLVVGRTGQLARSLLAFSSEPNEVVALGRPEFDMTNEQQIDEVLKRYHPGAIVNAAAYTFVDKAETETELAFKINRDGAACIARAAGRLGLPLIHVSTDYVFDGTKIGPYDEQDGVAPLGVYGRSKYEGEKAVLASHPAAVVIRTSWIYSPFGHNFVKTMLRFAETRNEVHVVDDQYGAPTSARNLAKAIVDIVQRVKHKAREDLGGIYHLTAAGKTNWYEFAEAIFAGWSDRGHRVPALKAIKSIEYPTPVRRPANSQLDCTKAARVFGVRLPHWRQGLASCLDELAVDQTSYQSC